MIMGQKATLCDCKDLRDKLICFKKSYSFPAKVEGNYKLLLFQIKLEIKKFGAGLLTLTAVLHCPWRD